MLEHTFKIPVILLVEDKIMKAGHDMGQRGGHLIDMLLVGAVVTGIGIYVMPSPFSTSSNKPKVAQRTTSKSIKQTTQNEGTAPKSKPKINKLKETSGTDDNKSSLPSGVHATDWDLILVNNRHQIKHEVVGKVTALNSQVKVNDRIVKSYLEMVKDAKKQGINLQSVSGYRSISYQKQVYKHQYATNKAEGMSATQAKKETAEFVARPGGSEHATGLAMDIVSKGWGNKELTDDFAKTKAGKWLATNAYKYGFILRFPKGKEKSTGIAYEAWHFRYVGKPSAKYMYDHKLTLEEYVTRLNKQ